jgi:hypothetical protein
MSRHTRAALRLNTCSSPRCCSAPCCVNASGSVWCSHAASGSHHADQVEAALSAGKLQACTTMQLTQAPPAARAAPLARIWRGRFWVETKSRGQSPLCCWAARTERLGERARQTQLYVRVTVVGEGLPPLLNRSCARMAQWQILSTSTLKPHRQRTLKRHTHKLAPISHASLPQRRAVLAHRKCTWSCCGSAGCATRAHNCRRWPKQHPFCSQ